MRKAFSLSLTLALIVMATVAVSAQSFRVQCPTSTITHPDPTNSGLNNAEPTYTGPTYTPGQSWAANGAGHVNGAIKCQQISGGDGYSTMADGTQTFMFSFGPLSGLADIAAGLPGTEFPNVFNTVHPNVVPGDPATSDGANGIGVYSIGTPGMFTWNGAVGLTPDIPYVDTIYDALEGTTVTVSPVQGTTYSYASNIVTVILNTPNPFQVGDTVVITGVGTGYNGTFTVTASGVPNIFFPANYAFQYTVAPTGLAEVNEPTTASAASVPHLDGHVDPRQIMDVGVMNGNIPAPLMAFDEDDEFFLTLSNVGMIMRPDLFEQHTVHFHGYPNASSFYDGVPDASVAINIGGSFTYYYLAPDAGTYFWHCHITPPEHLQMGMVGQLYVRPRQNRVASGASLYTALQTQQQDLRTACAAPVAGVVSDVLCSTTLPALNNGATQGTDKVGNPQKYVYNDGDGSSAYDVEYPIQIHGFDPNFHFVGMTFNPEAFAEMKDKFFLLNGRSYPDTVQPGPQATQSSDGRMHYSQPLPSIINIPVGGKAALRLVDLSVSEYATLASMGIPMHVVGYNAKLLRDEDGNNTEYFTNSVTIGGGESVDVVLDVTDASCGSAGCAKLVYPAGSVFYLYTPQLDHLSNSEENFGGLMTEVHICNSVTGSTSAAADTFGNVCN